MEAAGPRLGEAGVRRLAAMAGALLLASACASPPAEAPRAEAPAAAPPPVSAVTSAPTSPRDACGAAELQSLIGRPRTEIPAPIYPDRTRVACTTCPITEDVRPDRLNIFFDAESGLIRQIRCG
ncbi:MAG: peptidase inhibitor I78 [Phenylobacterium sp.]|nr:MAG: peptidase inhibitor I78 [Phenylobacterium sp.]